MPLLAELEARRLALQEALDGQLDRAARNRMGQFATPTALAVQMQRQAQAHLGDRGGNGEKIRFLDPAVGTGAFYSALLDVFPKSRIGAAVGYEIDPHYGEPARTLWSGTGLDFRLEDFTRAPAPSETFDLLICNPPYVRHHHIAAGEKRRLRMRARSACAMDIGGLAGLYCYFLGLGHAWMADGGLAGWLIPSEFMDVNYGAPVKRYLLDTVTLLHIHRFDPNAVQFGDAFVSSSIVWFRNTPPPAAGSVRFTFGGTLARPDSERLVPVEALRHAPKWTRHPMRKSSATAQGPVLGDFFQIKRGLATGGNSYFILPEREIASRGLPIAAFKPILPSPRHVPDDEIASDCNGNPLLDRRVFLLDPPWTEQEIRENYPNLWAYLQEGKAEGIADRYICRHRSTWYAQECRPPAPFVCTYLGRSGKKGGKAGRPFRFILNHSQATAANVYLLLYPKGDFERVLLDSPELKRQVWKRLNRIRPQAMLGEGRVYGGGLHKLEPRELGNVPAAALADLLAG